MSHFQGPQGFNRAWHAFSYTYNSNLVGNSRILKGFIVKKTFLKLALTAMAVGALALTGCMTEGAGDKETRLTVSMGVKDVNKLSKGGLSKSSTISLAKVIVTLKSSVATDSVVRDTILPGDNGFSATATADQSVSKSYNIKPLRSWKIYVKTVDVAGVVIHEDSAAADSIEIGESRPVSITLGSKYVMYVAKFTLPDSIGSQSGTFRQQLNVNRFMLVVDGDTVRDSSKVGGGYFAVSPTVHTVGYDYVAAGSAHVLKLFVFGDMGNWPSDKPLYGDSVEVAATDTGTTKTPTLTYTGPGSPSDPNWSSTNPGGAQIDPLEIVIGKVGVVEFEPTLPPDPLPKK
jgi:hypothetical protein